MAAATVPRPKRISKYAQRDLFTRQEISHWTDKPARKDCNGRSPGHENYLDPDSPTEQCRSIAGWTKLPHAIFADLGRVARGGTQILLLLYILDRTAGRERKVGEPAPEWTPDLSYRDAANICGGCTGRQIQEDLTDLSKRKVIKHKKLGGGKFKAQLLEDWQSIPEPKPLERPEKKEPEVAGNPHVTNSELDAGDDTDDATTEDDDFTLPASIPTKPVDLTRGKPIRFRAGGASRVLPIRTAVSGIAISDNSPKGVTFDMSYSAMVQPGGQIAITTCVENVRLNGIKQLTSKNGSTLPIRFSRNRDRTVRGHARGNARPQTLAKKRTSHLSNNIASKNGSVLPQLLQSGLAGLNLDIGFGYAEKLAAQIPAGCPIDDVLRLVQKRVNRRSGSTPFNEAMLSPFIREDVAEWWAANQGRIKEDRERAAKGDERQRAQAISTARKTLADPGSDDEDRRLSREILERYGEVG